VNPFETLRAAYAFVSAAQDHPPEEQVAGVASLFIVMCQRLGLDAPEELHRAERVVKDANTHYAVHVRALEAYIESQLKGRL
jgi:hypothetical protein